MSTARRGCEEQVSILIELVVRRLWVSGLYHEQGRILEELDTILRHERILGDAMMKGDQRSLTRVDNNSSIQSALRSSIQPALQSGALKSKYSKQAPELLPNTSSLMLMSIQWYVPIRSMTVVAWLTWCPYTTYRQHGTRGLVCGILFDHGDVSTALQ